MTSPQSFLEKNKGFVLKLRLVGVGGSPQIRRVRLPRVAVGGEVSYDALVSVAISYTFPGAPIVLEDYDVALTYYDVDNDCVTIASTEELMDAIDQFADVLRITTDVKRKKNRPIPSTPTRRPSRGDMDTEPPPSPSGGAKQLQTLMESIVGILATAVVALQSHMNPAPAVASSSPVAEAANRAAESAPAVAAAATASTNTESEAEDQKPSASKETPEKDPVEKKEAARPFIHGRHTCDRCLSTPIVGERYHATNLPDYDLCGKCKDEYKGTEIQFECVELDRDRPFQERWHRKRERLSHAGSCGRPGPRGMAGRRGPGSNRSLNRPARVGMSTGPHRPPGGYARRSCGPMAHRSPRSPPGARARASCGPTPHRSPFANAKQMDDALREAIRRSLQDVKKAPAKETKPTAPSEEAIKPSPAEEETWPAPAVEEAKPSAPSEEETKPAAADESKPSAPDEEPAALKTEAKAEEQPSQSESFSVDAVGNGVVAEVLGQTLDQLADSIDAMVKEVNRSASESSTNTEENEEDAEPAAEVMSVDSVEEEPDIVVETVAADDDADAEEAAAGATIVESVDTDAPTASDGSVLSERTEDEWQVLSDDGEEKIDDEVLARAAQIVGSALFESDNLSRGEASSLSVGADASLLSSVPTISSDSNVPTAVLDLWAPQLIQLRELGFVDDAASVDVLERLQAANIGSDSTDDISVDRVVDELLKKKD